MPDGLNSDLNLNVGAPPRVRPRLGEWGPQEVPATKQKKRMRWYTILALLAVVAVLSGYGYWIYTQLR